MQTNRASGFAATGLPAQGWLRLLAALVLGPLLLPGPLALAQGPAPSVSSSRLLTEGEDYPSSVLQRHIRICPGTVWPERTERVMMPVMTANAERFKGKRVLDIGTGSGILALYAAQLGAAKVVATDIDPAAIECTRENALKLGVAPVIEARLVSPEDPSAYSVIRPGEVFDIILGTPPGPMNRAPAVVSGVFDEGISPNDNLRLGLSIVGGLREHLAPDGAAILWYRFAVVHSIVVSYARHLGYQVEHHPALQISAPDWYAVYCAFAAQVARAEKLELNALVPTQAGVDLSGPGDRGGPFSGVFIKVDHAGERGVTYSRLWDKDLNQILPGMMVIRKQASEPRKEDRR
jgi:SAM-dependent methyltransferase